MPSKNSKQVVKSSATETPVAPVQATAQATAQPPAQATAHPVAPVQDSPQPVVAQPTAPVQKGKRNAGAQPAASQPAASQPAASQPVASQPAASQPAASQPAASQPTAAQKGGKRNASAQPASAQPVSVQSASAQPASAQPVSVQSASAQPASVQPGARGKRVNVEQSSGAVPRTKRLASQPATDGQASEVVAEDELSGDRRIRSFKVRLPNSELFECRFTGLTPYQAANKALSKYFRETKNPQVEVTFSICESTRKSRKGVYTYVGKRQKLETPVVYKIQDGREIVKSFKNSLKKVKKSESLANNA
jgi:hypothetical protein